MGRNKGNKKKQKQNKSGTTSESKASRRKGNREGLRKVAAQNFNAFSNQLENLGLRIKEVKGDGNCLFRSVADQIEGEESNHNFFRESAIKYITDNQYHFKFFIEDDQTFEEYVKDMSKDGTWGGNLEIYALSMKFSVNFYIYIYNHPMYIVKNFTQPFRNVHLTYHDGQHYNSVRLKDDLENEIPVYIPLDIINCVEQTTNINALHDADEPEDDDENEENKKIENINEIKEEIKAIEQTENIYDEIIFRETLIKDYKDKAKTDKFKKCIMTPEGIILEEVKDLTKCHCSSKKKYKNCCLVQDIKGDFDKNNKTFYCDLDSFRSKFHYEIKEKHLNKENSDIGAVTNKLEKIFI